MMPPTRLEQLGNFQDSIQSPEGLERLRALQYIQSALPSSQGLMGMPQVSAPVVARQYGGEVGTGGLVEVLDDGTQVFSNTEEGILNRSLHGGILQGQQQTGTTASGTTDAVDTDSTTYTGPTGNFGVSVLPKDLSGVDNSALDPLLSMPSVQSRGGVYNASEFRDAGISLADPEGVTTTIQQGQPQVSSMYRDPHTGKIPYALYQPQPVNTYGDGFDLGGLDYFTANQLALNSGADRFMYNNEYAAVDPGLLSNYNYSRYGSKPYGEHIERDKIREATIGPMHVPGRPGVPYTPSSADREEARLIAEGFTRDYSGRLTVPGTSRAERYRQLVAAGVNMDSPYTRQMHGFKHGGSLADTAQGLASFGRYGDNILVHMNPEELSGLASLGEITYNPVTGLPEAFSLKGIFKGIRKLAPIVLAVAAPYALGAAMGTLSAAGTGLSALQFGLATGVGSFVGNKIAGAKTSDALKSGLLSGAIGGIGQGISTGNWAGNVGTEVAKTAPISEGTNLLSKTMTGDMASYGGKLVQAPSQFTSSATNIGTTLGPASSAAKATDLANIRKAAFAAQPQAYGITPQIQAGQVMTAPQLQAIASPGGQTAMVGPGGMFVEDAATGVYKGSTQSAPMNMIERFQQNAGDIIPQIKKDYGTWKGAAKLVGMDLMSTDWEQQYANEAKQKEMELQKAGYTVDTGFDGQTVIRDSQGVIMPRNLTPSMILDRALGRSPRQRMISRYGYGQAKHGGLISLAHGGEFSGQVPGDGHGMEDNVYMPIKEGSEQVGTLAVSPSEYVVDSYTMAALGNGNTDEGAKVMDKVVKYVRKKAYGTTKQPNEISGLKTLEPMMERV